MKTSKHQRPDSLPNETAPVKSTGAETLTVVGAVSKPSRKKFSKQLIYLTLIILGVLCIVLALTIFNPVKLEPITYNNGQGYSFSMQFYSKYYLSSDFNSLTPAKSLGKNNAKQSGVLGLASKDSRNGKYPIWLAISVERLFVNPQGVPDHNNYSCGSLPTVFTINSKNLNQKLSICSLDGSTGQPAYSGAFIDNGYLYHILITQVADKKELSSSNNASKMGLADYQNDLKTIIGSIKPLQ